MQGGQQFKLDQPGLTKAGPAALIVAAICGALGLVLGFGLNTIAVVVAGGFAGVWYVMTARKMAGSMPAQLDGLVNGAILGAVAGLVYGVVLLIVTGLGFLLAGTLVSNILTGAILGAIGAFGYSYLVQQGTIK